VACEFGGSGMPEGDTVWRTAQRLRDALAGQTLTRCDVRVPRFAAVDLTGEVVDEVLSRGKHLFIRVGQASIHSHLKMDGSWLVHPRARPPRPPVADYKIRIILDVLDRTQDVAAVAHLGPDVLGDDWSAEVAAANLAAEPERPLAEALLDQRVLAGVGNVYANELCFVSGLRPTAPVSAASDPVRLVSRAQKMLWANRSRVNRTTTGDTRRGGELWVYGRAGQPCRRCGTLIETDRDGDRVTYWCPACQR
jgi:formamidopyrimidine-DNA glycosylase